MALAGKDLFVHDMARDITERLPTEVTYPWPFAWSPDHSEIVYSARRVSGQLRLVSVAGTAEEQTIFQSDTGEIESLDWSPDGDTIFLVYGPTESRPYRGLWAFDVGTETAMVATSTCVRFRVPALAFVFRSEGAPSRAGTRTARSFSI